MSIELRCDAASEVMDRICHAYDSNENAQLIELMLEGQSELEKHGLGSFAVFHSLKTVVHPRNRGTAMLETSNVPEQVAGISDVGFCLHEVLQAAAVRMPPNGTTARREIEMKNEELVGASMGTLAPVIRDDAEIMVVGCSHNSAGLKAINAKARCSIDSISENGLYCAAKIIGRCPSYMAPIQNGLKYFTVEYPVDQRWPSFINLTIDACNIGSALAKPDNVLQLMRKAHSMTQQYTIDGRVDYDAIVKKMARTKPSLQATLPQIVMYVERWSGGAVPHFLNALVEYGRTLQEPKFGNFTGPMLDRINKLDFGVGRGGRYRLSLLKALLAHDKMVTVSTFSSLSKQGSNAQNMAFRAEEELHKFEQAVAKMPQVKGKVTQGDVVAAMGVLDKDVVAYVHNQSKEFKSMNDIFVHHFDKVVKVVGGSMKNPFRTEPIAKVAKKAACAVGGPQELGALGHSPAALVLIAAAKGMTPNTEIVLKGTSDVFLIIDMDEATGAVSIARKSDKRKKINIVVQSLIDTYKPFVGKELVTCNLSITFECIGDAHCMTSQCASGIRSNASADCNEVVEKCNISHNILRNEHELMCVTRALAVAAMYVAREECHGSHGHVTCAVQPTATRKVISNKAFPENKLQLICFTTNLHQVHEKDKTAGVAYVEVICPPLLPTFTFQPRVQPFPTDKDGTQSVIPYWLVGDALTATTANLTRMMHEVTIGEATVRIPMYVNCIAVSKGDMLTRRK